MFDPKVGTECLVIITHGGGSGKDADCPELLPSVPCRVAYVGHEGPLKYFSVTLLRDAKPATGWYRGNTYRASRWQLKSVETLSPQGTPVHV